MKYIVFLAVLALGVPAMSLMAMWSRRVRGWLLAGLIFSTSLSAPAGITFFSITNYRGPDRGLEFTLTDFIAWALVIALTLRFPQKVRWLPYNSCWMFLLFGLACIATWLAPERSWALFTLFKFIRVYVLFWCTVNCLRSGVGREYVWKGLLAIGMFMTVIAIKQRFLDDIYRIHGPFDHSNIIPLYLNMIMPVLLLWGLCDRSLTKGQSVASALVALGMMFTVGATLSRGGIALNVACLLGALAVANVRAMSVRVMVTSLIVFMVVLGGSAIAAKRILDRIQHAPPESLEARKEFNVAAARMLRDHFFGVGLNNYSYVLTRTPKYREYLPLLEEEEQSGFCHHIYWLTAAETGYLGLVAFLIVIARFTWLAGWYSWGSASLESVLLCGFFTGFCAVHLGGLLEWAFRTTPVLSLFAVCAGVCVAFAERVKQPLRPGAVAQPLRDPQAPSPVWGDSVRERTRVAGQPAAPRPGEKMLC